MPSSTGPSGFRALSNRGFTLTSVLVSAAMASALALLIGQLATLNAKVQKTAVAAQTAVTENESLRLRLSHPDYCTAQFKDKAFDYANPPAQLLPADAIQIGKALRDGVTISRVKFQVLTTTPAANGNTFDVIFGDLVLNYSLPTGVIGSSNLERTIPLRLVVNASKKIESCGNANLDRHFGECGPNPQLVMVGVQADGSPICKPFLAAPTAQIGCANAGEFIRSIDATTGKANCGAPDKPSISVDICGGNGCAGEIGACINSGGTPTKSGGSKAGITCVGGSMPKVCDAGSYTGKNYLNTCASQGAVPAPNNETQCKSKQFAGNWVKATGTIPAHCVGYRTSWPVN